MKILITGINGLLGKDIARVLQKKGRYQVIGVGRSNSPAIDVPYIQLDLTDISKTKNVLNEINPDIIIHCAAYTRLDDCEKNKDYAELMNVEVTGTLADFQSRFIYISSDAVFSGNSGNYCENDEKMPVNYYGQTKLKGEKVSLNKNRDTLIIRSSIYGYRLDNESAIAEWGYRALKRGESITGFDDVIFNPLYSGQLAEVLLCLIEKKLKGIIHLGCDRNISKYEFFRLIADHAGLNKDHIIKGFLEGRDFIAQRTKNTSLNITKMKQIINKKNDIENGIEMFLADLYSDKG